MHSAFLYCTAAYYVVLLSFFCQIAIWKAARTAGPINSRPIAFGTNISCYMHADAGKPEKKTYEIL